MNKNIASLHRVAEKTNRNIIGLMSGTSLDGLDIALCNIEGHGRNMKLKLENFITVPYDDEFKQEVKSVFSKEMVNLQQLTLLNEWIGKKHAAIINDTLSHWKTDRTSVDCIASHGQTIYHAPLSLHGRTAFGNGTLQIGDGDHIAVHTGILTISDFRQKHIAAGGEGAPLAAYGDYLLFSEKERDVILLNIGGIANFSYLPGDTDASGMFSSDVGPGNTMMDAYMQQQFPGNYFDTDATIAKQGTVNEGLLKALLDNNFLQQPLPKTTGPELFNLAYLEKAKAVSDTRKLGITDTMATLNRFTAVTIVNAIAPLLTGRRKASIYASGGGIHNPLLMDYLSNHLEHVPILSTLEKGINPDAKEAVLFAILANECIAGEADSIPFSINNFPAITMGKISFPG